MFWLSSAPYTHTHTVRSYLLSFTAASTAFLASVLAIDSNKQFVINSTQRAVMQTGSVVCVCSWGIWGWWWCQHDELTVRWTKLAIRSHCRIKYGLIWRNLCQNDQGLDVSNDDQHGAHLSTDRPLGPVTTGTLPFSSNKLILIYHAHWWCWWASLLLPLASSFGTKKCL